MKKEHTKLKLSDIGYYGKPVETLSMEELQSAFLDTARILYNCVLKNENCIAFSIRNQDNRKNS